MKKVFIISILLQTSLCFVTRAQQTNIRRYSIEDGLVNNDVLNIYQDSHGFIWLATRGGLSRYDGSRFTNFTTDNGLTDDMINDIVEIAPQEFIVAQNSGGPVLLKNDTLKPFSSNKNMVINSFYVTGNHRLLAVTDFDGIVEMDSGKFRSLRSNHSDFVSKITILNDSVWLLLNYESSIQLTFPSLQPLSAPTLLNATVAFHDSRQRTWIGTTHGLLLMDPVAKPGKAISFLKAPAPFNIPELSGNYINCFTEDSHGNFWIGTLNGLIKITPGRKASFYSKNDGLPSSSITCLKEDNQHNIWVGTKQGMAKLSMDNELSNFSLKAGTAQASTVLLLPLTKNIWRLFDEKNVTQFDLLSGRVIKNSHISPSGYRMLKTGRDAVLVVNSKRAMAYHSAKENFENINWPDKFFHCVLKIDQYRFLAAINYKLFVVENGKCEESISIAADTGRIHCMAMDNKNNLWAGTRGNGLFKISLSRSNDSIRLKVLDTFAKRLPDQYITAIYAGKKNELWVGTSIKGVIKLTELPGENYSIQQYGTDLGLSSNLVTTINGDSSGNIWVGTGQGLDKLIPTGKVHRVFNFGKLNKVFSNGYGIYFLDDNYLLATNYSSVLRIKDLQQDTLPPPLVYITNAAFAPSDTSSLLYIKDTRLPYNKGQIYFEFSSPQYINEDFTKYSYRLRGSSDTSWNISGKSHNVYFARLRPGDYLFEVRALGFNGHWGSPAVYGFTVSAPFWQKWWFMAICILVLVSLVYLFYRYRVRQLLLLQKVRNRIATDLHDEIGSSLTNISILSSLSKKNLLAPDKAKDFLQRISEEVSSSSQALDDIIWSVNSSHDTMEETVTRMRRYAAELFDAANIRYELYLDPAFEDKKLAMEQRRDIYLLYREAVNNISKHADAKQVSIKLTISRGQILLHIKDHGKGFDAGNDFKRHGLKGMKERVIKWKGKIEIESVPQKGAAVEIRLPLAK
jgi:ligand-binding sensor domain-containing protein/two-component sensor histidine kinase